MAISPTAEGFRAAFRQPLLTFAEMTWRWTIGTTATLLFLFGLFEYLQTLPVTNGELLFLKTRQPFLVSRAIEHIFRGSLTRVVISALVAAALLSLLWMVAGSIGRIATVRALLEYFRAKGWDIAAAQEPRDYASKSPMGALVELNFLRVALTLAAAIALVGAAVLAGLASASNPDAETAASVFIPLAGLVLIAWMGLNWLLSLAAVFAVRDSAGAMAAIAAAVKLCRERSAAVFSVSSWTGLAHLVVFVSATVAISAPLGFVSIIPCRVVLLATAFMTLVYFAVADWVYMARLAGYVCIAETPEALL